MELQQYLRVAWRRRWLIALSLAVAASAALLLSARAAPQYQARASVFVGPRDVDPDRPGDALSDVLLSREFVQSFADMVRRAPVVQGAINRLDADIELDDLTRAITTRTVPDTRTIEISVRNEDPRQAQRLANAVALSLLDQANATFVGQSPVRLLERATEPEDPVSPKPMRDGMLGAMLGLMLGLGAALLLENMDSTLRSREETEEAVAPLPVLAVIPSFVPGQGGRELLLQTDPKGPAAEAFRILRTGIQFLGVERPIKTIVVTSPYSEDGKTTTSVNLAAALAAAGMRTLLLEADLRRPVLHEVFKIPQTPGLTDVLVGRVALNDAIRETQLPRLYTLPAGPLPPNPAEILGSQRMADVLAEAEADMDAIVVDTPPTLPVADAGVLAGRGDGAILVLRAGRSHRDRAREAVGGLTRLGVHILGVVLNGVGDRRGYGYGGYYYSRYYERVEDRPSAGLELTAEELIGLERPAPVPDPYAPDPRTAQRHALEEEDAESTGMMRQAMIRALMRGDAVEAPAPPPAPPNGRSSAQRSPVPPPPAPAPEPAGDPAQEYEATPEPELASEPSYEYAPEPWPEEDERT